MRRLSRTIGAGLILGLVSGAAFAHGDVTPQGVDVSSLPPLGDEWLDKNPYTGNEDAIKVGKSAYGQNCARCHGLDVISGGIAPDLRNLNNLDKFEADEWFMYRVRNGAVRDGRVYMPPFEGIFKQEAMWAIKAYIETRDAPQ